MRVRALYFAAVREIAGLEEELILLPEPVRSVADFGAFLVARYPRLQAGAASLRFARNEVFAAPREAIAEGDVIAVLPPVAGG
jgi:molybdopterin converting factor subunit 1